MSDSRHASSAAGGRRGGRGSTGDSAAGAHSNAWMDALWELHCGTPLAGAVRYTDPIVEAMWDVFRPLLREVEVYPLAVPEEQPDTITATTAATVALTSFVLLRLVGPTASLIQPGQRGGEGNQERSTSVEDEDVGAGLGAKLTPTMCAALLEQPRIVLALVEFFIAVWLYQYESHELSRGPSSAEVTTFTVQNSGGEGGGGAAALALPRVYAAVSGDVRHAIAFDRLGAAQLGRLLTIKGTVVRMSPTRISCVRMSYRCGHCGAVKELATEDGILAYPGPCPSSRCRGYKWTPMPELAVCEEVQLLRLQEHTNFFDASTMTAANSGNDGRPAGNSHTATEGNGGVQVMIEVELRPPWLDAVTVGDGVCVTGILETRRGEGKQGGGMQQVCLRARAVRSLRSNGAASSSSATLKGITALQQRQCRSGALLTINTAEPGSSRTSGPWRAPRRDGGAAARHERRNTRGEEEEEEEAVADRDGEAIAGNTAEPASTAMPFGASVASAGTEWWTAEEAGRFYEVARHPQWFARLTASVAPSIFGMELAKQALLLAIVGGNRDKNGGETRSSIHVLLVGDPGLGKSQLLRAACAVAPRSAFVCAHTSSTCGLTMTLTRDPVSGETTFEAGAVVHGDGGITCLDEIDKGVQEHKALLEVMEQEMVSLAKAGMIFSMPVRTSVLAAGNAIGGRFDVGKSLAANVNLSPALLSRFDIVVCLRNPHGTSGRAQQALTDHVLRWHRHPTSSTGAADPTGSSSGGHGGGGALPLPLVQRFLLFCRSQCQPTLCREACDVLEAHYLAQRQHLPGASSPHALSRDEGRHTMQGGMPHSPSITPTATAHNLQTAVTPRYLQALIRVAEARAKVELRHEVTREDAEYAVLLLQDCLHSFDGFTSSGTSVAAATGRAEDGGSVRKSGKPSLRDAVLQRLKLAIIEENGGVNLFTEQAILDVCESVGCRSAAAMLRQLNEFGLLLQKSGNRYCLSRC